MLERRLSLLLVVLLLSGCNEPFEVRFLSYMDCRTKMRSSYESDGMAPMAADMKSKAYCNEVFGH